MRSQNRSISFANASFGQSKTLPTITGIAELSGVLAAPADKLDQETGKCRPTGL
jgi:hypothetical protein